MTHTEVLKLALEALEKKEVSYGVGLEILNKAAIAAIKEALAQPQQEPVSGVVIRDGLPSLLLDRNIKPTDQRLYTSPQPAPVQHEPVAWSQARFIEDDDGCRIGTDEPEVVWGKTPPDPMGWSPLCYCEDDLAREPVRECNSIDCQYIDGLGKTDCDWCRPKKAAPQPAPVQQELAGYFHLHEYGSSLIHEQVWEEAKNNEGVFPLYTSPQPAPVLSAGPITPEMANWSDADKAKLTSVIAQHMAPQEPAPGYCKNCKQYTIEEPLTAQRKPLTRATIADARDYLNTNDKAMWVIGWNECVEAHNIKENT